MRAARRNGGGPYDQPCPVALYFLYSFPFLDVYPFLYIYPSRSCHEAYPVS